MFGRMRIRHVLVCLFCLFQISSMAESHFWKRTKPNTNDDDNNNNNNNNNSRRAIDVSTSTPTSESPDDIPDVPFLVEALGKEIYAAVNKPKYKFYFYMTIGKLPDETTFVTVLNMICNLLYGLITLVGFVALPRGFMLMFTALTIFVGPALVLILLGTMAALLVAFALYPITSVASLWVLFFSTSRIAQVLGVYLGLDSDKDGDVDWLDVLHYLASTQMGKLLRLDTLHDLLNNSSMDPFREINRRLDEIQQATAAANDAAAATTTTIQTEVEDATPSSNTGSRREASSEEKKTA
eukprot:scaffold291_cov168-Amphora_coffeaeformis.AAC.7